MVEKDSFREYVLDQLRDLGDVWCKRMFGGYGLYSTTVFFGIVYRGRLYFKTDSKSRSAYIEMGMKPFRPNTKQTLKNYFEVPPDVLEDPDQIVWWAREAERSQRNRGPSKRQTSARKGSSDPE